MNNYPFVVNSNDHLAMLSNFSPRFGLKINGEVFRTTEHLFESMKFPDHPDVQRHIVNRPTPSGARLVSGINTKEKPFKSRVRSDWSEIQEEVMEVCVRLKLVWNWIAFGNFLRETVGQEIRYVTTDSKDSYWGVRKLDDGDFGENRMGKILMKIRDELVSDSNENLRKVEIRPSLNLLILGQPVQSVDRRHHLRQIGTKTSEWALFLRQ